LNSNGEIEEFERPRTIPDDFIYDPEINGWCPPGECDFDLEAFERRVQKTIQEVRRLPPIPKEQLQVPAWVLSKSRQRRKSPAPKRDSRQRTLFSDDDDPAAYIVRLRVDVIRHQHRRSG
jgi:hypothetical protein